MSMTFGSQGGSDSQLDAELDLFLQQIIEQEDLCDSTLDACIPHLTNDSWPRILPREPLLHPSVIPIPDVQLNNNPDLIAPLTASPLAASANSQTTLQPHHSHCLDLCRISSACSRGIETAPTFLQLSAPLYSQASPAAAFQPAVGGILEPPTANGMHQAEPAGLESQQGPHHPQATVQPFAIPTGTNLHATPTNMARGANKRSHAWSEKNRRAQQRFRDRQKAHKQELQQQIAEKQAAAEALQVEHRRLVGQQAMLASILDTQQTAVNILQGQQQAPQVPSSGIARHNQQPEQLTQNKADSSQSASTLGQGPGQQGHMQQVSFPDQLQQGLMQQGQFQQEYMQQPYPPGTASHVDQDDDYCKSYAVLVEDLNKLLKSLDGGGSTPELQLEIQNQTRAAGYCMKQALLMNPDNMKDLLSGSSGPALAPGPAAAPGPGPQHSLGSSHSYFTSRRDWQAVTDCLQMTAEQKQQIMQLRGSFLQEQAHHQAQWRLLCQCMHQGKDAVKAEVYREALKQTPNGFYRRQLYVLDVNLRQQQAMWVDLHHSIFYKVWSPEQCARAIVESGLHYVDALAIANCVARQLVGDRSTL